MKKKLLFGLSALAMAILVGIAVPKVFIKNQNSSSGSCVKIAQREALKFPNSLYRTARIIERSISSVEISYYTLFGIKYGGTHMLFCTLTGESQK